MEEICIWEPQPGPQTDLVTCPVFEILYGGARGGGKTDAMIGGDWLDHAFEYGPHAKGIFFRRELPQLEAAIARSKEIYTPLGAQWKDQPKTWVFPNGAVLKFRPLERDSDAEKYQGHDYTRVYFEELTNYPDAGPVMKIKATLRSGAGVPVGFRATANPGGPGHQWVKQRYIDPAPQGYEIITEDGLDRVFIPAKLADNLILTENDPQYVARLYQSGSKELVRAWLHGDWDVIEGAFFDCWEPRRHLIKPFEVPSDWQRFRSMDWGSAKPFSVGWWAIAQDDYRLLDGRWIPRGALVRYREWYGCEPDKPNTGLKMTAEEVGQGIAQREVSDPKISYGVLDPAAFAEDGGPSIAERMARATDGVVMFRRADNKRVGTSGAMGGWDQLRARMVGEDFGEPMGDCPMMFVMDTCKDFVRTVPALQHDQRRPEDVDTDAEDHIGDEARYAVMSRPYAKRIEKPEKPVFRTPTLNELWAAQPKKRKRL